MRPPTKTPEQIEQEKQNRKKQRRSKMAFDILKNLVTTNISVEIIVKTAFELTDKFLEQE